METAKKVDVLYCVLRDLFLNNKETTIKNFLRLCVDKSSVSIMDEDAVCFDLIKNDQVTEIKLLMDYGYHSSPINLKHAMRFNKTAIFDMLLQYPAILQNINQEFGFRETAFSYAFFWLKNDYFTEKLVRAGANVNKLIPHNIIGMPVAPIDDYQTPLFLVLSENSNTKRVKQLVRWGADIDFVMTLKKDSGKISQFTSFHVAFRCGPSRNFCLLLKAGADFRLVTKKYDPSFINMKLLKSSIALKDVQTHTKDKNLKRKLWWLLRAHQKEKMCIFFFACKPKRTALFYF